MITYTLKPGWEVLLDHPDNTPRYIRARNPSSRQRTARNWGRISIRALVTPLCLSVNVPKALADLRAARVD
jgi:hypothetical protein